MSTTTTALDKEIIVKYKGWVVYKGQHIINYTEVRRCPPSGGPNMRKQPYRPRAQTYEGRWIQHDHYKGGILWASWEPKAIDNKCSVCHEMLDDVDLAKLMCFAKAIK